MSDGAMTLLAWLVLAVLAAVRAADHVEVTYDIGVTSDIGVTNGVDVTNGIGVTSEVGVPVVPYVEVSDYPAATEQNTTEDAGAGDPLCPRGCKCVMTDVRHYYCGEQHLKYKEDSTGSYMEVICSNTLLDCPALPPLPPRRRDVLQRIEVKTCSLPPSLPLTCATGGETSKTLQLERSLGSLSADNVRGLDVESLFLTFKPGALHEIPMAAIEALPRLRSVRIMQATSPPLRGDMFLASPPITVLEISLSRLGNLPANAFRGLHALKSLSLWGNDIKTVHVDAFKGLEALEALVLDRNPLVELPPRALARAPRLRRLHLSYVRLPTLQEGALDGLEYLQEVVVSSEVPLQVGKRAFSQLPSLGSLQLVGSQVSALPGDLFHGSSALVNLTLSNNKLSELPDEVFSHLQQLQRLDLSHNQLGNVSSQLFRELVQLRDLNLDWNRLRNLPEFVFSGLSRLTSVSLAHNQLVFISYVSFSHTVSLEHLSLSHNNLTWSRNENEESSPFHMLTGLKNLVLSYNAISVVYSDWRFNNNLVRLNLSHNSFTELSQADVQFFGKPEVDFSYNQVRVVHPLVGYRRGARVTLDHNPLHCDCQLYDFIMQVQSGVGVYATGGVECSAPQRLAGVPLATVHPPEVTCPLRNVTAGCACLTRPAYQRAECVCNHTQVPSVNNFGVDQMSLVLTRAPTAAEWRHLPAWVRNLTLANLSLAQVPDLPATVRVLNLTQNQIRSVPQQVLDRNMSLYLRGNQLSCACADTDAVWRLQRHRSRVLDYADVRCEGGELLAQKDAAALCDVSRATLAAALVALAVLLLGGAGYLLHRYTLPLQVLLYRTGCCLRLLPKEDIDDDKKYDVYVSFAREDERLVREEILPNLEGRYRVHVQDRDWVVGNTIPAEIHRSIEQSRRTVILLSSNFVKSMWAAEGFRTVHAQATSDKRMRAVVILLDVKKKEIDKETKVMLSLSKVLRYKEAMFWDKLHYALPRRATQNPARGETGPAGQWKGPGLHVLLNDEGKLVNRGYEKDYV